MAIEMDRYNGSYKHFQGDIMEQTNAGKTPAQVSDWLCGRMFAADPPRDSVDAFKRRFELIPGSAMVKYIVKRSALSGY